jgi:hypothetical protein
VEIRRTLVAPCAPSSLYVHVEDLSSYPAWMPLVHDVRSAVPDDGRPAWDVELQAQVGPFTRSKQLRMVRSVHEPPVAVRFERAEHDGRRHAPWQLDVRLTELVGDPVSTELTMTLAYGGGLWTGAVLQRVLDDHVDEGRRRLLHLVTPDRT